MHKRGPKFRKTSHRNQEPPRSPLSPDVIFQPGSATNVASSCEVTGSMSHQNLSPTSAPPWGREITASPRDGQSSISMGSSLQPNWQTGVQSVTATQTPPVDHDDSVSHNWASQGNHIPDIHIAESMNLPAVQQSLIVSLQSVLTGVTINTLTSRCVDLYAQYLFPIMPIIHESTLRHAMSLLQPNMGFDGTAKIQLSLDIHRCFALVTAVCAEVSFILPSRIFREGPAIANLFLQASRKALNLCHDLDLESPNSSSLIIRYLHSNCTHALGQARVSWHLLGESIRLAQEMCLFDEHTFDGVDPIESQLLRNIFWQLYTGDKSSALLNNRPVTLHEFNLRTRISVSMKSTFGPSLLDSNKIQHHPPYENQIMTGFCLCQRMWSIASDLLLDLQLLHPVSVLNQSTGFSPSNEQRETIMDTYLRFLSVVDDLPPWLSDLDRDEGAVNDNNLYQQSAFWIQRINLKTTFHSLNLIIIQKFFDLGLSSLVGVSSEPLMMSLKKTDVARDMLVTIQRAPFESLQINGESCVSLHCYLSSDRHGTASIHRSWLISTQGRKDPSSWSGSSGNHSKV